MTSLDCGNYSPAQEEEDAEAELPTPSLTCTEEEVEEGEVSSSSPEESEVSSSSPEESDVSSPEESEGSSTTTGYSSAAEGVSETPPPSSPEIPAPIRPRRIRLGSPRPTLFHSLLSARLKNDAADLLTGRATPLESIPECKEEKVEVKEEGVADEEEMEAEDALSQQEKENEKKQKDKDETVVKEEGVAGEEEMVAEDALSQREKDKPKEEEEELSQMLDVDGQSVNESRLSRHDVGYPTDEIDGWMSTGFIKAVKSGVLYLLDHAITGVMREGCNGCAISHPSQRQHQCLEVPEEFYKDNFYLVMKKLYTPRFIPAIRRLTRQQGFYAGEMRVKAVVNTILNELRPSTTLSAIIAEMHEQLKGEDYDASIERLENARHQWEGV